MISMKIKNISSAAIDLNNFYIKLGLKEKIIKQKKCLIINKKIEINESEFQLIANFICQNPNVLNFKIYQNDNNSFTR